MAIAMVPTLECNAMWFARQADKPPETLTLRESFRES
jgi:hypothetical protein